MSRLGVGSRYARVVIDSVLGFGVLLCGAERLRRRRAGGPARSAAAGGSARAGDADTRPRAAPKRSKPHLAPATSDAADDAAAPPSPRKSRAEDPNATREMTYVVVPEGLKVSVARCVRFAVSARAALQVAPGVGRSKLSVGRERGRTAKPHSLSSPKAGPMAFAGYGDAAGKSAAETPSVTSARATASRASSAMIRASSVVPGQPRACACSASGTRSSLQVALGGLRQRDTEFAATGEEVLSRAHAGRQGQAARDRRTAEICLRRLVELARRGAWCRWLLLAGELRLSLFGERAQGFVAIGAFQAALV